MGEFADIVAGVLEVDPTEITDDANPDTLPTWTSLRHLQVVAALEDNYGLSLSYREIRGLRSVGAIRTLLKENGVPL